jgi:hypothetical protein
LCRKCHILTLWCPVTYLLHVHMFCHHCPLICYLSTSFVITPTYLFHVCLFHHCHPPTCCLFVCFTISPTCLLHVCLHRHCCPPILPSLFIRVLLTCLPYLRTITAYLLRHHCLAYLLFVHLVHVCFKLQAWYFPLTC